MVRERRDHVSAMSDAPLAHSAPTPTPARNRNTSSSCQLVEKPETPVKIAYTRIERTIVRLRPRVSARTPPSTPPVAHPNRNPEITKLPWSARCAALAPGSSADIAVVRTRMIA